MEESELSKSERNRRVPCFPFHPLALSRILSHSLIVYTAHLAHVSFMSSYAKSGSFLVSEALKKNQSFGQTAHYLPPIDNLYLHTHPHSLCSINLLVSLIDTYSFKENRLYVIQYFNLSTCCIKKC